MERLVIKFGGTSVMTTRRIQNAASIVVNQMKRGYEILVVVSAMGYTTDHMLAMVGDVSAEQNSREIDLLLSTGEQISAALMAMALKNMGCEARSLTGGEAGILTNGSHGDAAILSVNCGHLEAIMSSGCIPVVAGFQGITREGDVTTLGRGGSDTTAIALASAIGAIRCDIYSDVRGIFSADPNKLEHTFMLDAIAYDEMIELAANGAQVLCKKSVQLAKDAGMPVRVRSTFCPDNEGTLVTAKALQVNKFTSMACTTKQDCIKVWMEEPNSSERIAARAFRHNRSELHRYLRRTLIEAGIESESASSVKSGCCALNFCVCKADTERAVEILSAAASAILHEPFEIETLRQTAKISIVANEVDSEMEVDVIRRLTAGKIPIILMTSSQHRLSVLVPEKSRLDAMQLLHLNYCMFSAAG